MAFDIVKTKTQWRAQGRGLKKDAEVTVVKKNKFRSVCYYNEEQTVAHKPYTVARNYLVDMFVGWPDRFGYTESSTEKIVTVKTSSIRSSAISVIERGFNYEAAKNGIMFDGRSATSFHVAGKDPTNWFVIDLDNHHPTAGSTSAHVSLLEALLTGLPDLHSVVSIQSVFFQYRMITPTGIQMWVVCGRNQPRKQLFDQVRQYLVSLGSDLDRKLRENGLSGLNHIEIKPTTSLISMIGSYGKEVFTTQPLKIIDKRFDCIGLHQHIKEGRLSTNVLRRYRELVYVRELNADVPQDQNPQSRVPSDLILNIPTKKLSWTALKSIALHGVTTPDELHDKYLEPLAQALLFREFINNVSPDTLVFDEIKSWLLLKHNNFVSRIISGDVHLVENQIWGSIKTAKKKTPDGIRAHYAHMLEMDKRFPQCKELLVPLMRAKPNTPPLLLIDCKGGISESERKEQKAENKSLPSQKILTDNIRNKINEYCEKNARKGHSRTNLARFMRLVISEIGLKGEKFINQERFHRFAGKKPDSDPTYLKRYKTHLVKAGLIKKGWEKFIVRNKRSSKYTLCKWVLDELRGADGVRAS